MVEGTCPDISLPQGTPPTDPCNNAGKSFKDVREQAERISRCRWTGNDTEAARLYRLAADQGYARAQDNLGLFYEQGRGGLPKDYAQAARLYRLAADQGHPAASGNLRGLGRPP